ncbi:hypothetical protein [Arthrobacter sp. Alg241-R88]|uniref:terminase small subunit n=1 Tax=Arthrobacter sp. Alg241-R88 TaxID=2305984 RepID=UPI0013D816CB|nr:hypothetical protein [Arthrobacter sp. Alg241-R88]
MTDLVKATEAAIAAATHLVDSDQGAVEAMRALARKIDAWDLIVAWAIDDVSHQKDGGRPAVPANDNVSISAYLKYCDQLGLTPAGRKTLDIDKGGESGGSKLGKLRSVHGG